MDEEELERYVRAGGIAKRALDAARGKVLEGGRLCDVALEAERTVLEAGAGLAFPVNISIDAVAAHYTPVPDDPSVFERGQVVKLDIGAHVEGCIADTAATVEVGTDRHGPMVRASREALRAALELVRPGIPLEQLGGAIEEAIRGAGYSPIVNLTGHTMRPWELHAGKSVLNVRRSGSGALEEGEVVAIEPFATDGEGRVSDSRPSDIYRVMGTRNVRMPAARALLADALGRFRTLPFARRMVVGGLGVPQATLALKHLVSVGAVHNYPILREHADGVVTQAEHTVVVLDGPVVTTR